MLFRHADSRFPFLWESEMQPSARWHTQGEGPVQYLADTVDGAWAEFLRHEGITDEEDLLGVERNIWAIELLARRKPKHHIELPLALLQGGADTYPACQVEARRLRLQGLKGFVAPSAALLPGTASGWYVEHGALHPGSPRDGTVLVLFGPRPDLIGWCACFRGRPSPRVLPKVHHFRAV
jgi:hypothetical protein